MACRRYSCGQRPRAWLCTGSWLGVHAKLIRFLRRGMRGRAMHSTVLCWYGHSERDGSEQDRLSCLLQLLNQTLRVHLGCVCAFAPTIVPASTAVTWLIRYAQRTVLAFL